MAVGATVVLSSQRQTGRRRTSTVCTNAAKFHHGSVIQRGCPPRLCSIGGRGQTAPCSLSLFRGNRLYVSVNHDDLGAPAQLISRPVSVGGKPPTGCVRPAWRSLTSTRRFRWSSIKPAAES